MLQREFDKYNQFVQNKIDKAETWSADSTNRKHTGYHKNKIINLDTFVFERAEKDALAIAKQTGPLAGQGWNDRDIIRSPFYNQKYQELIKYYLVEFERGGPNAQLQKGQVIQYKNQLFVYNEKNPNAISAVNPLGLLVFAKKNDIPKY